MERIEIYTSKKKSALLLICSITFVSIGVWMVTKEYSNTKNLLMGYLSIVFFGLGIFIGIKNLIKPSIALIIDQNGININPRKSLTKFIEWDKILGFKVIKIQSTKILIIMVTNPDFWIEKETNMIRKKLMQYNLNNYKSPFNIASSGLKINTNELNQKLNFYLKKYKNKN